MGLSRHLVLTASGFGYPENRSFELTPHNVTAPYHALDEPQEMHLVQCIACCDSSAIWQYRAGTKRDILAEQSDNRSALVFKYLVLDILDAFSELFTAAFGGHKLRSADKYINIVVYTFIQCIVWT